MLPVEETTIVVCVPLNCVVDCVVIVIIDVTVLSSDDMLVTEVVAE